MKKIFIPAGLSLYETAMRMSNIEINEINLRETLEIESSQLSEMGKISLINTLVTGISKERGLSFKTTFSELSKGKHLLLSVSEQLKKDKVSLERVRREGKYLADLIENNNFVSEEYKETVARCAYHNQFDSTTRSFLTNCRKNLKKICAIYRIEYDLKQFREIKNEGTI